MSALPLAMVDTDMFSLTSDVKLNRGDELGLEAAESDSEVCHR